MRQEAEDLATKLEGSLAETEKAKQEESAQRTLADAKRKEAEDLATKLEGSLAETEQAKQEESAQRTLADAKRKEAEWQLYLSQIYRAAGEIESGRARRHKRSWRPFPWSKGNGKQTILFARQKAHRSHFTAMRMVSILPWQ